MMHKEGCGGGVPHRGPSVSEQKTRPENRYLGAVMKYPQVLYSRPNAGFQPFYSFVHTF